MQTILIPYQKDSALLFEHFVQLPYAIFLDSAGCDRYDIITADPIKIIHHAVFDQIKTEMRALQHTIQTHALPFTIGAMGYLSYDIGRELEVMPTLSQKDISLPEAFIGIYDWSIVVDHHTQQTYFTSAKKPEDTDKLLQLLTKKPAQTSHFKINTLFESNVTRKEYQEKFNFIKKNIVDGNCYQVNFAQRFSSTFEGDPWSAYKILRQKNPAPFSAFISIQNDRILSTSPERFLKVHDRLVETKPIKGTSKRYQDPELDAQSATALRNSEKDQAENVMIVDLLRNDLSKTCIPGSVSVPTLCALESFANVHHLVSTVTGTLSENSTAIDALKQCFPGGSITGAPKIAAMKMIEQIEPHRRSLYCGSIFYIDISDHMDSNIAIRTTICTQNKIHCYAGGGIVYDSECNKEHEECLTKVGNILKILSEC